MIIILSLNENPPIITDLRCFFLNNTIENFNADIYVFCGFRPSNISEYEFNKFFSPDARRNLDNGGLGVSYSHAKIWEFIANNENISENEFTLVFEEDATIRNKKRFYTEFGPIVEFFTKNVRNNNAEFVYLGHNACTRGKINKFVHNLKSTHKNITVNSSKFAVGFHSYLISKTCAKKLVNYLCNCKISYVLDNEFNLIKKNLKLIVYTLEECDRVFSQTSTQNLCEQKKLKTEVFGSTNYIGDTQRLNNPNRVLTMKQSENVKSIHPVILSKLFSKINIYEDYSLGFFMKFTRYRFGNITFSYLWIFYLIIGFILGRFNFGIKITSLAYLILILPDFLFYSESAFANLVQLFVEYLIFISSVYLGRLSLKKN